MTLDWVFDFVLPSGFKLPSALGEGGIKWWTAIQMWSQKSISADLKEWFGKTKML